MCVCVSFATRSFWVRARVYFCLSICVSEQLAIAENSVARKLQFNPSFVLFDGKTI